MKKIAFFFTFGMVLLGGIGYAQAQSNIEDKQAVQMLKEFYIAYNAAWSTPKGGIPVKKLDSLQRKYCTEKLRSEVKKAGFDHDLLLGEDNTYVEHLKTITVIRDPTKASTYIVSYINHTTRGYKPIDINIVLHVTMVKEDGNFKISYVKQDM